MDNVGSALIPSPPTVGAGFHARPALVDGRRWFARTDVAPTPQSRRKAPRQLPFQGSRGRGWRVAPLRICLPRCGFCGFPPARKGRRPRRPAFAGLPGRVRRTRPARPMAPAFDTAHLPRVHSSANPIPRAQPAHHLARAHPRRPSPRAGRASPPAHTAYAKRTGQQTGPFWRSLAAVHLGRLKRPRI